MTNVDLKSWPPEPPHIIEFAQKHNELDGKVISVVEELNKVTGDTEEKKEAMYPWLAKAQNLALKWHSKRIDGLTATFQVLGLLWLAKALGIDTTQIIPFGLKILDFINQLKG